MITKTLPIIENASDVTDGKRTGIVSVVLEPEAVAELKVVILSCQDAGERRTQHRTANGVLRHAGRPEVDVVNVSVT